MRRKKKENSELQQLSQQLEQASGELKQMQQEL
jgi:hypothetical protein